MKIKRSELFRIIENFLKEQDDSGEEEAAEETGEEEAAEETGEEEAAEESEEEPASEPEEEVSSEPIIVSFKLINKAGDVNETINIESDTDNNMTIDIVGKKEEVLKIKASEISDKNDDAISFIYSSIVQLQNDPGGIQKLLKLIERIPFFKDDIVKNEQEIDISPSVSNLMKRLNTRVYNVNLNSLILKIKNM